MLEKEGFTVETPVAGIQTAFKASYGSGKPVIGILAEFDALSGLSQEAGAAERRELVPGGNGHGCGHNMLGAGSLAAAFAVKKYLEDGHPGTVIFYGCPGEEGGAAPGSVNQVTSGTCNTCIQTEYKFTGIASHASGSPELGRSALDAVELMNVGVQFLREHMPQSARIHYAITDAGGNSPNVVQPHAQVLYMVRSVLAKDALALQERVDKIAQGAAMMTETTVKKRFIDGCSNTVPNKTLETLFWKNFNEVGVPTHTPEEVDRAAQRLSGAVPLQHQGASRLHRCRRRQLAGADRADQRRHLPVQFAGPQLAERLLRTHLDRPQGPADRGQGHRRHRHRPVREPADHRRRQGRV